MTLLLDGGAGAAIGPDELVATLADCAIDVRDEDAFASLAPLLGRIGRNKTFLAELAVDELKSRCRAQSATNGYGAQVFVLRIPGARFMVRANFWPAATDRLTRASGAAAFFYDLPHDHNFPFLTHGYLGPGYWSDYYEYDAAERCGFPGEAAGLRFSGRQRLEPDTIRFYRMLRDVHVQLPPDSFSVSINILGHDPAQPWLDQHRFDVAGDRIDAVLTTTPAESLLTLAVHLGDGIDIADAFARSHPCDRMRVTALAALADAAPEIAAPAVLAALESTSGYVAGHARALIGRSPP